MDGTLKKPAKCKVKLGSHCTLLHFDNSLLDEGYLRTKHFDRTQIEGSEEMQVVGGRVIGLTRSNTHLVADTIGDGTAINPLAGHLRLKSVQEGLGWSDWSLLCTSSFLLVLCILMRVLEE